MYKWSLQRITPWKHFKNFQLTHMRLRSPTTLKKPVLSLFTYGGTFVLS